MEFLGIVQRNGVIVIPKEIRDLYSIVVGTVVRLDLDEELTPKGKLKESIMKRPVGRPPKYDDSPCPECSHGMYLHRTGKCGYVGCTCTSDGTSVVNGNYNKTIDQSSTQCKASSKRVKMCECGHSLRKHDISTGFCRECGCTVFLEDDQV